MAENQEGIPIDVAPAKQTYRDNLFVRVREKVKFKFTKRPEIPLITQNPVGTGTASQMSSGNEVVQSLTFAIQEDHPEQSSMLTNLSNAERLEGAIVPIYRGLEKLDNMHEEELNLEFIANHSPVPSLVEKSRLRLAEISVERKMVYEKYNISAIENPAFTDDLKNNRNVYAKFIAEGLAELEAKKLPPVKDRYVRMFRGEGSHPGHTDDDTVGRWFAPKTIVAFSYPIGPLQDKRMEYIDIPQSEMRGYHYDNIQGNQGAGKTGEYLLPKKFVDAAKEFIRFLKADTTTDPWAKAEIPS